MKNRKIVITAFLLFATLLMGVGYAAISGDMLIQGSVEFLGFDNTQTSVKQAIKFTDDITTSVNDSNSKVTATRSSDHGATMDVVFQDTSSSDTDAFTASATYTIEYDTDDADLPKVTLAVSACLLNGQEEGSLPTGWDVDVTWGNDDKVLEATDSATANKTTTVTVTVKYTNQAGDSDDTPNLPLRVSLNFTTN